MPVFNRWEFTRQCIEDLHRQTYSPLVIIVSDGGSTDETRTALAARDDVVLVFDRKPRWWAGSVALGIEVALRRGAECDFVLLVNNDTRIPPDYVAKLVACSRAHDAAVGGVIVDSGDPSIVLDSGVSIDWTSYTFPADTNVPPGETFRTVDTLPGRGTLAPLRMIRAVGNVDDQTFPHYIADYDLFCRIKAAGFRLGVCYQARILAHIDETGIAPDASIKPLRRLVREIFSRRSMSNWRDHQRFIARHAPAEQRARLLRKLHISTFTRLVYHTRLYAMIVLYRRLAERYPMLRVLRSLTFWMRQG
jgi:GT2 family glycosyltransferase